MRLSQKKIEEMAVSVLGEGGLPLIKELYGKENISEFDLANKTKKDIKVIRKMLYLLHNHNLVGFTRKKDKQKGWYIYYWTLLPESITFLYLKKKKEMVEQLKQKLDEEGKELFFVCPNNCARLNFDQAMDFEFHCPECGELLSQDASQKTEEIKKKIDQIEGELKSPSPEKGPKTREIRPKNKKVITRKLSLLRKKIKLKKR